MYNKTMRYLLAISIVLFIPFSALANVVINEVAWMGMSPKERETSQAAANNEWIELKNLDSNSVNLSGWALEAQDGQPAIAISETCKNTIIQGDGYFLLERSDDNAVPGVAADCIYTGALENEGEYLVLKNSSGATIDSIDASLKWLAGDNSTKETMQKTSAGNWITAQATPRAKNYDDSSSPENQNQTQITEPDQTKQIRAEAGEDKTVFIGQKTIFQGKVYGFDGKEIQNARFLWNFGDGMINEGNPISHIYRYLGEYIVILNGSSGIYANSDQLRVKVSAPPFKITGLKPGENGFIEISNQSNYELDISGFSFSGGKKYFYFPENSMISPNSRLLVPGSVSGINFASPSAVEFYYPDGSLIQEFKYESEKIADKNIIAESPKISAPMVKNTEIKDIVKNKEENVLASSATVPSENREKQRSIYFWMAIVFGIASFSGVVSFFFIKSRENDKIPQK